MKRFVLPLLAALALGGCASSMTLVRMDGQRIAGNPQLQHTANVDSSVCKGETQKAQMSGFSGGGLAHQIARAEMAGDVFKGCMAQKGYAVVNQEEAEKTLTHFASLKKTQ